jgi:hypothetical protein
MKKKASGASKQAAARLYGGPKTRWAMTRRLVGYQIGQIAGAVVRAGIASTLRRAPVSLWRRLFPKSTVGVCYHMVSDARSPHLKHYRRLTVAEFEADLDYLQESFGFVAKRVRRRSERARHKRQTRLAAVASVLVPLVKIDLI